MSAHFAKVEIWELMDKWKLLTTLVKCSNLFNRQLLQSYHHHHCRLQQQLSLGAAQEEGQAHLQFGSWDLKEELPVTRDG